MRILEGKLMRYFSGMVDSPIEVCLAIELIKSSSPSKLREAARLASGLSQNQAAELIKASPRSWENWEQGRVKMHPGLFDYFLIKTKQKNC